jgi:hypothetical protein
MYYIPSSSFSGQWNGGCRNNLRTLSVLIYQFLDELIIVNHDKVIFDCMRFKIFTVVTSGVTPRSLVDVF